MTLKPVTSYKKSLLRFRPIQLTVRTLSPAPSPSSKFLATFFVFPCSYDTIYPIPPLYLQLQCPVEELVQSILQGFGLEPIGMEWHHIGCLILFIVTWEILLQPFEDLLFIQIVQHTLIHIGTMSALKTFDIMRIQWHLPYTWERTGWTGTALAFMRDLVIQCVWPHGHRYWGHCDRTVIDVAKVFQNLQGRKKD